MKGKNMFDLVMRLMQCNVSEDCFRPFTVELNMWVNFVYVAVLGLSFLGIVTVW